MNRGPGVLSFGRSGSEPRRCSFCGRREDAVQHLVRVRGAYICDLCVAQAHEAIASAPPGQRLLRIRPTPGRVIDRDAAEEAIERAFETAFSSEIPIAERCQAIERGTNLAATMEEVRARYAPAQNVDVSVDYVRFVSEDEAEVHFALLLSQLGPSGLTQTGHAVLVEGEWKVSRDTWCRLVSMAGVQCPPPED
jgi:ClpX C4-type zinc finger